MFCIRCGKEIPDSAQFCHHCGGLQEQNQPAEPQTPEEKPQEAVRVPEIKAGISQPSPRKGKLPAFLTKKVILIAAAAVAVLCLIVGIVGMIPKKMSADEFDSFLEDCCFAEITLYDGGEFLFAASTFRESNGIAVSQMVLAGLDGKELVVLEDDEPAAFKKTYITGEYMSLELIRHEYDSCYISVSKNGALYASVGGVTASAESGYEALYAQLAEYLPEYGQAINLDELIPDQDWKSLYVSNKKSDGTFEGVTVYRSRSMEKLAEELRERTVYIGGEEYYILDKFYAEMRMYGSESGIELAVNGSGNGHISIDGWEYTIRGASFLVRLLTDAIS